MRELSSLSQTPSAERTTSTGELTAALSNAVVQIYAAHKGQGPAKAKTYLFDNVVLTVMEESAAMVEQTLAKAGEQELVQDIRKGMAGAISEELKGVVEDLTGRRVRALMSGSQLSPDIKCDVFLLEAETG